MRSLRGTLTWATTGAAVLVLAAAAGLLYGLVRAELWDQFDHALLDKARFLTATVEDTPEGLVEEFHELGLDEFERHDRPAYVQAWQREGRSWFRSRSLGGADLPRPEEPLDGPRFAWLRLPDGRSGRLVALPFRPRVEDEGSPRTGDGLSPEPLALVLARDVESVTGPLARLRFLLLAVGAMTVLTLAAVLAIAVRRGLRPLDEVAARIAAIDVEALASRLAPAGSPQELQGVIARLNDLLERLEAAFLRERALNADVAHELRTPLAGLRTTLEVALSRRREPAAYETALGSSLEAVEQLQTMVEELLTLSRLEAGQMVPAGEPVDLDQLARTAWAAYEPTAQARELRVEWQPAGAVRVVSDAALLGLALRNLFENAVTYADAGGTVAIALHGEPAGVWIEARNTGSTLDSEAAAHACERFWRGDVSRQGTGEHSGLGLSLVKTAVEALGGGLEIRSEAGGWFAATIRLPSGDDGGGETRSR